MSRELLARARAVVAEDERLARDAADDAGGRHWRTSRPLWVETGYENGGVACCGSDRIAEHVGRHDPRRALARCARLPELLDRYERALDALERCGDLHDDYRSMRSAVVAALTPWVKEIVDEVAP